MIALLCFVLAVLVALIRKNLSELPTNKLGNHEYIETREAAQLSLSLISLEVRP